MKNIPHSRPTIGKNEISAVASVLKSGLISLGSATGEFEKIFAKYHSVRGGVAVNSGTSALHTALLALGVTNGDAVIIPTYSCIALLNAVKYTGAKPVLADTAKGMWDMDAEWVESYLEKYSNRRRVKAIIAVHLFGKPADMDRLTDISNRYSIPLIEDCAMALGAEYKGRKVGSFGDISVFSFYATKVITTGEGGMLISNSPGILSAAKNLREYDEKKNGILRFNYKMTDFQSAMGISQMKRLPGFIKKRRLIAKKYIEGMKNMPIFFPEERINMKSIYFRFVIKTKNAGMFIRKMASNGIVCRRPVFMPIHRATGEDLLPNAERIWEEAVSLPIYPLLDEHSVNKVIASTRKTMERLQAYAGK